MEDFKGITGRLSFALLGLWCGVLFCLVGAALSVNSVEWAWIWGAIWCASSCTIIVAALGS